MNIPFNNITMWMQIHGLPSAMVHEGTVERIGNRVGTVHLETINKRYVVTHSYLHFQVDIPVTDPIPAIFSLIKQMMNYGFSSSLNDSRTFVLDVEC